MRIGIHVRGFERGRPVAVEWALERGAETIQIFVSNPRGWRLSPVDPEADEALVRAMNAHDIGPLYLHLPYLVNLASPSAEVRGRSHRTLAWALERAEALGGAGIVVHAGTAGGQRRQEGLRVQARAVCELLGEGASGPRCLIELTAGAPGAIANRFPEAAELLDACHGHPRLEVCVDTCHLHAAGYELSTPEGLERTIDEMRFHVGLERLALVHANDSRHPRGSRRDVHWHLGQGAIGEAGFGALVAHPALRRMPIICETPGALAEDRRNIDFLKKLRNGVAGAGSPAAGSATPIPAGAREAAHDRTSLLVGRRWTDSIKTLRHPMLHYAHAVANQCASAQRRGGHP